MATAVLLTAPLSAAIAAHRRTSLHSFPSIYIPNIRRPLFKIPSVKTLVSSKTSASQTSDDKEERIFFDGGAHYGDLVSNLLLGFTLFWLPLTIAAVSRAFFLRYRFTNRRVSVISGFTGQDRSDFPYSAIKDVQVVPRLIGEWGDIVITLKDGTKVDLRSVPRFRMVADYCLLMADGVAGRSPEQKSGSRPRGF